MSDVLEHHGILGQKWGVRRTPAQLGHPTSGNGSGGNKQGAAEGSKNDSTKTPGKSSKKPRAMTDEELRQRINRLNMEEQYDNLVARQKARNTGTVKKALGEALESLGRKALGIAVDKVIEKISNKGDKGDKFDINDWKDEDVNNMDADTIQKVAKWYQNARSISTNRASGSSGSSSSSGSTSSQPSGSSGSESSSSSPSASRARQNSWVRDRRAAMRRLGTR